MYSIRKRSVGNLSLVRCSLGVTWSTPYVNEINDYSITRDLMEQFCKNTFFKLIGVDFAVSRVTKASLCVEC